MAGGLAAQPGLDAAGGRALFERTWVTPPSSTRAADGLGPYYDARSCAACHPRAGQGEFPDSLTVVVDDDVLGRQLQRHAVVGLPAEAQFSIGTDSADSTIPALQTDTELPGGYSLRLPPPLAGVAALDAISETELQRLADPDDRDADGISGRYVGRFGWKGEARELRTQIAKALSLDIGIGNAVFPSPAGDCTAAQTACRERAVATTDAGALEAEPVVLDLLTAYLQALPPPVGTPGNESEGRALFETWRCSACHVPALSAAGKPLPTWSDLLVHDLGPGLADRRAVVTPPGADPPANAAEWRTPPLWGLVRRARLLHDGRATTPDAAIRWHDGEAAASRLQYEQAKESQRELLLSFLRSL